MIDIDILKIRNTFMRVDSHCTVSLFAKSVTHFLLLTVSRESATVELTQQRTCVKPINTAVKFAIFARFENRFFVGRIQI